jgi:hypothetical protein
MGLFRIPVLANICLPDLFVLLLQTMALAFDSFVFLPSANGYQFENVSLLSI